MDRRKNRLLPELPGKAALHRRYVVRKARDRARHHPGGQGVTDTGTCGVPVKALIVGEPGLRGEKVYRTGDRPEKEDV